MATREETTLKNKIRRKTRRNGGNVVAGAYTGLQTFQEPYTDADYALVLTSGFVGDSSLGSYNEIITWHAAFAEDSVSEILSDLENLTTAKIEYYNSQSIFFTDEQSRQIVNQLIREGRQSEVAGG